jgi:hypothetical protein
MLVELSPAPLAAACEIFHKIVLPVFRREK